MLVSLPFFLFLPDNNWHFICRYILIWTPLNEREMNCIMVCCVMDCNHGLAWRVKYISRGTQAKINATAKPRFGRFCSYHSEIWFKPFCRYVISCVKLHKHRSQQSCRATLCFSVKLTGRQNGFCSLHSQYQYNGITGIKLFPVNDSTSTLPCRFHTLLLVWFNIPYQLIYH